MTIKTKQSESQKIPAYAKVMAGKPKLRFAGFSGEWEVVRIKDAEIKLIDGDRGVNYPKMEDFLNFSTGGYCLFLSNKNIKEDKFFFSELQFISRDKDEMLGSGRLQRGDVIITTRGTVGTVAFYDDTISFQNIRINSGMLILRAFYGINAAYLYHLLKSPVLKKKYKKMVSGSAQPQLPVGSLGQIFIPIPSEEEQQKIADFLTSIDNLIKSKQQQIIQAEQWKKGLMQGLFV